MRIRWLWAPTILYQRFNVFETGGANRVINFTRVERFGDHQPALGDVNWLLVNVDPASREVFMYQPQIVNRDPLVP